MKEHFSTRWEKSSLLTDSGLLDGAEDTVDKAGHDTGIEAVLEGQAGQGHVPDALGDHCQRRCQPYQT